MLGIDAGTSKSQLSRGRQALRRALDRRMGCERRQAVSDTEADVQRHARLARVEQTVREAGLDEVRSFGPGRRTGDLGWPVLNWLFGVAPALPLDRVYYRGLVPKGVEVLPYTSSDHSALLVRFALPD